MIIKLKAGLGNVMFQYAFGRMLEERYGIHDLCFDTSYFYSPKYGSILDSFNSLSVKYREATEDELQSVLITRKIVTPKPYTKTYRISTAIESVFNKDYFFERNHTHMDPAMLLGYKYLDGYWQSWSYFQGMRDMLQIEFSPKINFDSGYCALISEIQSSNSVALCIRKGDYLSTRHTKNRFYNCSPEYYVKAINFILNNVSNPIFYIFTNDNQWVRDNIEIPENAPCVYRESSKVFKDYLELQLIKTCKHAIISNSTFHWWGAWLSDRKEKIIIRPQLWFADGTDIDIYPSEWVNIECV